MALPKQVQKQAEELQQLEQAMEAERTAKAEPQPEKMETPEAPEPPPAAVEPPPLEPTATETPPTTPPVQPKSDDGQWEQKYRTLQGMFARETQTLRTQLHTVNEQLAAVQQQMKEAAKEPAKPSQALVTEKDTEAFGADLVDLARRVAREEFGAREQAYKDHISALEAQVKQQVGAVQQTAQQTSRDMFFAQLGAAVPTWEATQATEACQQWLASRVPGAQFTWNDVLVNAAEQFDVQRATEVFNTFLATQPKPQPQPTSAPRARAELSRQVAPPKTAASTTTPTDKRVYGAAEYESESMKIIKLSKAGKYDEAARIEQELNAALLEGRVRP